MPLDISMVLIFPSAMMASYYFVLQPHMKSILLFFCGSELRLEVLTLVIFSSVDRMRSTRIPFNQGNNTNPSGTSYLGKVVGQVGLGKACQLFLSTDIWAINLHEVSGPIFDQTHQYETSTFQCSKMQGCSHLGPFPATLSSFYHRGLSHLSFLGFQQYLSHSALCLC